MLFRRRTPLGLLHRVRVAVWPSNGWGRSIRYFGMRVLRLSGSPHAIALGVATGVFVSWTPFLGFHVLLSIALAFIIGGNLVGAGLGTFLGNPLTFPLIWWSTLELGDRLLGIHGGKAHLAAVMAKVSHASFSGVVPVLGPMVVGALPLGLASALVVYIFVLFTVRAYQSARRNRLERRRQVVARTADMPAE